VCTCTYIGVHLIYGHKVRGHLGVPNGKRADVVPHWRRGSQACTSHMVVHLIYGCAFHIRRCAAEILTSANNALHPIRQLFAAAPSTGVLVVRNSCLIGFSALLAPVSISDAHLRMVVHLIYGCAYIPHMSVQLIGMCLYRGVHLIHVWICISGRVTARSTTVPYRVGRRVDRGVGSTAAPNRVGHPSDKLVNWAP
jgi:hypothetical protein